MPNHDATYALGMTDRERASAAHRAQRRTGYEQPLLDVRWIQVFLSYAQRPRFWGFSGVYLLAAWFRHHSSAEMVAASAATFNCVMACFLALHLRRQFGNAAARLTPHFAGPHLAVAAILSVLLWIVIPAAEAAWLGHSVLGMVSMQAIAGVFLAAVAVWPKATLFVAAVPAVALAYQSKFLLALAAGQKPQVSAAMIVGALAAQGLAARALLRLSDCEMSVSDDLDFDVTPSSATARRGAWSADWRDALCEQRIATLAHSGQGVARWRIPGLISWTQLLAAALAMLATTGSAAWITGELGAAWLITIAATGILLFVPFGPWRQRREMLSIELMRPVTRGVYFRQIALAIACDVSVWLLFAIVLGSVMDALLFVADLPAPAIGSNWQRLLVVTGMHQAVVAGMAILLYGLALLTIRVRYWLPWMIGLYAGWSMVLTIATRFAFVASQAGPSTHYFAPLFMAALSAVSGIVMAWLAYRNWLVQDVP